MGKDAVVVKAGAVDATSMLFSLASASFNTVSASCNRCSSSVSFVAFACGLASCNQPSGDDGTPFVVNV